MKQLTATATVSGSFHVHMRTIAAAVAELGQLGVRVLSPSDPRIVDAHGEFLFVASDRIRSVRLVEDKHLECIRASSFLWLVTPDGYVGQSASMELGVAVALGVPVYSDHLPADLTLRQYVQLVASMTEAVLASRIEMSSRIREGAFLLDPHERIDEAQSILERLRGRYDRLTADHGSPDASFQFDRSAVVDAVAALLPVGQEYRWTSPNSRRSGAN